jgi:hypothetical protein
MRRPLRWLFAIVLALALKANALAQAPNEAVATSEGPAPAESKAQSEAKTAAEPPVVAMPATAKSAESQTHKWEFGISIRAVGGPCAGLLGTFPVPMDWPEQQVKVASEQISPVAQHRYRATDGLKQMVFNIPQLAGGASAECFVTFEITKQAQKPPLDTAKFVVPKDPPPQIKKFLAPSPQMEATNTKVRSLAREWTADKENAWEQVRAILSGVRETIKYERDSKAEFKGVLASLRDGKADREDLTATFVAVCRAAKIPARMVWAMDYAYAEFYLEELPPVDDAASGDDKSAKNKKGKESKAPKGAWYPAVVHEPAELGACNDFRPIMQKGDNFKVPEEGAVQRYVKEFLKGKGGTGGKPSVEFRRRNAD